MVVFILQSVPENSCRLLPASFDINEIARHYKKVQQQCFVFFFSLELKNSQLDPPLLNPQVTHVSLHSTTCPIVYGRIAHKAPVSRANYCVSTCDSSWQVLHGVWFQPRYSSEAIQNLLANSLSITLKVLFAYSRSVCSLALYRRRIPNEIIIFTTSSNQRL